MFSYGGFWCLTAQFLRVAHGAPERIRASPAWSRSYARPGVSAHRPIWSRLGGVHQLSYATKLMTQQHGLGNYPNDIRTPSRVAGTRMEHARRWGGTVDGPPGPPGPYGGHPRNFFRRRAFCSHGRRRPGPSRGRHHALAHLHRPQRERGENTNHGATGKYAPVRAVPSVRRPTTKRVTQAITEKADQQAR